jgi:uncharacterized phage-like protein YoqJ
MKTLAERKAFVEGARTFAEYQQKWQELPPMPIAELESVGEEALTNHLNYEQSGAEGYFRDLCMKHFYSLPKDWKEHFQQRIDECIAAADNIADRHAESYPTVAEIASALADLTSND